MLPGFQVASVGMTQAFDIQQQGFIQILHNGFGHWLTISTIGATSPSEVFVYDSLYYSIGTYVKRQIAAIMHRHEEKIIVNVMDVQKQAGGCDCGLFAIAFATALANGKQPGISIEDLVVLATFVCAINFY